MNRWNWTVTTLIFGLVLLMAPATAVAQDDNDRSSVQLSVGVKGGLTGVAGHGFENHESVVDESGTQVPASNDNLWPYPEYYGHFGIGLISGAVAELRFSQFLGVEAGYFFSQDNASGYVDKNDGQTGETLARINSEQRTSAHHIPVLAKVTIPDEIVRPYLGVGAGLVIQQSSELEYDQERRAGQYGENMEEAMATLNERNQIETSTYPLVMAAAGVELAFGSIVIPIEVRVGYALGVDREMEERARGEDGQIVYDGRYMGHFSVFSGVLYEFALLQ